MKKIALASFTCLLFVSMALAQMEMPKPAPELKKLDMMSGSWALDADVKPVMGPGGKVTENEKCDWMEGNFYLVCHVDFKSNTMGNGTEISIMGYSADDKAYTYRAFNSWGEFADAKGTIDGNTWTWTSDQKMGSTVVKSRFTMKITSPTAYDFSYEISQDGTKWTNVMDGKANKNK